MRFPALIQQIVLYFELALIIYFLVTTSPRDDLWWLIVALSTASQIITNTASIVCVKQTMDFQSRCCGLTLCVMAHVAQCGSLWRTMKLICLYEPADREDTMKLKLLHICIFSVPVCTVVFGQYLTGNYDSNTALMVAGLCFLNILMTFGYFSRPKLDMNTERNPTFNFLGYCWRLFTLFPRLSVFVWIANSPYIEWTGAMLLVHLLIMVVLCQLQRRTYFIPTDNSSRIWSLLLSVGSVIDFMGVDGSSSLQVAICYYLIVFCEMTAMILLKYYTGLLLDQQYHILWAIAALGSFTLGIAFAVINLMPRENEEETSITQVLQKCCCPKLKQGDDEKVSLTWDSYDTRVKNPRCRRMYTAAQRQEHVDIINDPLGVDGIVSLTHYSSTLHTNNKIEALTPECTVESKSGAQRPETISSNLKEVEAEITPISTGSVRTISTGKHLPASTLPTPYFLSPTGLRAIPTSRERQNSSAYIQTEAPPAETRRRLLYLTPIGLPQMDSGDRGNQQQTHSILKDLRPRWVDLNRLHGRMIEMQKYDTDLKLPAVTGNDDKVSEWLQGVSEQRVNGKTEFNPVSNKLETSL